MMLITSCNHDVIHVCVYPRLSPLINSHLSFSTLSPGCVLMFIIPTSVRSAGGSDAASATE